MSETRFTPGPWLRDERTVYALEHGGWRNGVERFRNRFSAHVCGGSPAVTDEELEATARIMQHAPDLYAEHAEDDQLLLKMATVILNDAIANHIPFGLQAEVEGRLRRGTPALAKARGETA